ncbi:hypothetical protein SAMN05518672_111180 [Chitinophaga sp. CF118]|uniref:hypothetical protein n=1 Tax=Chitinophaga sp. CF118 TaxID=1884367 RepID=UPI0008E8F479|nr:hypothetical protein [Chitinophaga sp. CF118]SFE88923.1 hypothetical protein SAMN05518672_111180 [Chitinophaga sp. CF118]
MLRNSTFSVITVTIYLVVYCFLLQIERTQWLGFLMFTLSPILVIWMVYTVLKYGVYNGRELAEGEEYGYQDKIIKHEG